MPFGHWENFESCLSDVKRRSGYSDEVAKKVCGKLKAKFEKGFKDDAELEKAITDAAEEYASSKPSPSIKDLKEITPVQKAWEFDPSEILNSTRKVKGTFHVPKVDKDREIITKGAMDESIPDFMHLPILHDFHRERALGIVTKVWEESDAYHFEALFKATHDVDDAWKKVQKGIYDHVSIYGSRLEGTSSCGLDPSQRATPCVTHRIRLDSISACDENARNDETFMTVAKSLDHFTNDISDSIIKAESINNSLVHGTYDGVKNMKDDEKKEDKEMEKAGCPHFMKGEHCKCGGCKHHTGGKEVEKGTSDNNTLTAKEGVSGSATAPSMPPHMQNAASAQDVIRSQNIKKAEPEVNVDEIVKAALTTKADEITKAFQSQIDELKAELEKVKEQPIVKSAVVIPEQVEGTVGSSNYKALGKFMKKRG